MAVVILCRVSSLEKLKLVEVVVPAVSSTSNSNSRLPGSKPLLRLDLTTSADSLGIVHESDNMMLCKVGVTRVDRRCWR